MRLELIPVIAAIAFVWASAATAATIVNVKTSDGQFGADTHINLGTSSNKNNGAALANGAQEACQGANNCETDSAFTARPILRFDLSGLPNGTITDAYFTFAARFVVPTIGLKIFGLNDSDPQDAAPGSGGWLETGITRNNAPAGGGAPTAAFDTTVGDETLTVGVGTPTTENDPAPTFVTFTQQAGVLKDNLVAFLNADTNDLVTFIMISQNPSMAPLPSFSFWSKEGADPSQGIAAAVAPTLTITVEPSGVIPVPATLPLLASGVLGLVVLARRRHDRSSATTSA